MPVSRKAKPEISRVERLWLSDAELPAGDEPLGLMEDNELTWLQTGQNGLDRRARELIARYGDAALAAFIAEYPGQRPAWWWRYQAPEKTRQRVGGTGTVYGSQVAYGLPLIFADDIDPEDGPQYEASAAYLKRHGLLTDAEAAGLVADDFAPEVLGDA
jgi:hypothetical protein